MAVTAINVATDRNSLQEQQKQQTQILNSLSQKLNHPDIFEIDTVFADKYGGINIVVNNKVDGKVYFYDLRNSRKYIKYPPKGRCTTHDNKNGKDYIKYGIYVPAEETNNK